MLTFLYGPLVATQPVDFAKTNPTRLYAHYMPWFETPQTLGAGHWGWHWTMNNQNPNVVGANGQRQIASHYYPQIGPYDSRDADVIEYHLLLMKLSGIDGVLIDWYGVQGTNGDINSLLANSNALIDQLDDFGLDFAVVLEDRFAASVGQAEANVAYLRDNYFNQDNYIRDDVTGEPLLPVFGPITFEQPGQWTQILGQAGEDVNLLTLPYESGDAGANADGEYAWPYENEAQDNHLQVLDNFLANRTPSLGVAGGLAYPGFDDFYAEGGVGDVVGFEIPHADGQTLADTLALNASAADNLDFVQLATWNDFGEGTILEPTVENGYGALETLQQFSGTPYDAADLELVHALYLARKDYGGDPAKQASLDAVSSLLAALDISAARSLLAVITGNTLVGDYNADGFVSQGDLDLVLLNWGAAVLPAGWVAADQFDGVVISQNELDGVLLSWGNGAAFSGFAVPEVDSAVLLSALVGLVLLARPWSRSDSLARRTFSF